MLHLHGKKGGTGSILVGSGNVTKPLNNGGISSPSREFGGEEKNTPRRRGERGRQVRVLLTCVRGKVLAFT